MRLNPHSRLARFYSSSSKELPHDLCKYVCGLVGRFFVVLVLLSGVGTFVVGVMLHLQDVSLFLLTISVFVGLPAFLVYGVYKILSTEIIRAFIKAKKEKYCPLIQWKDD